MESGCTLGGADRRIAGLASRSQNLPLSLQKRLAQHGYITWDHRALRLAWAGANWSVDGDLFLYLDTGPGGTTSTFSPYPVAAGGTTVVLPDDLQADVLIWVQDPGRRQPAALERQRLDRRRAAHGGAIPLRRGAERRPDRPLPAVRAAGPGRRRPAGCAGVRRRGAGAGNRPAHLGHAAAGQPGQQRPGQPPACTGSRREQLDSRPCRSLGSAERRRVSRTARTATLQAGAAKRCPAPNDGRERPARRSRQRCGRRPVLGERSGQRPVRAGSAGRSSASCKRRTRRCRTARRLSTQSTTETRAAPCWNGAWLAIVGARGAAAGARQDRPGRHPARRGGKRHVPGHGGPQPVAGRTGSGAGPAGMPAAAGLTKRWNGWSPPIVSTGARPEVTGLQALAKLWWDHGLAG